MNGLTLVWRNLWRRRLRTLLTLGSVAASLFLFTVLQAVVASMRDIAASSAAQLRLVVHHRTTMTRFLPLSCGERIAALPGVQSVCAVRWFGGRLLDSPEQFPSLAAQVDTVADMYGDLELREGELSAWRAERTAAIVGSALAQRMGWTYGQRVTLRSTIPPYVTLETCIVAITAAPAYPNLFALRLDYLLEAVRQYAGLPAELRDTVNFFWVKAQRPAGLATLGPQIDGLFEHSASATHTEPEAAFVAQFTMMFGDIPRIISLIGMVVVVSIGLVACNTMSMAIRERLGELALLRAVGFPRRRIAAAVAGEALLIGLLGGLIGCVAATALSGQPLAAALGVPYFPVVSISPLGVVLGVGVGAAIGLLAALGPVATVARLPVASTLRSTV